jgi:hypothetical protein
MKYYAFKTWSDEVTGEVCWWLAYGFIYVVRLDLV